MAANGCNEWQQPTMDKNGCECPNSFFPIGLSSHHLKNALEQSNYFTMVRTGTPYYVLLLAID